METPALKSVTQILPTLKGGITLALKREDLIHPLISGNKYRKLKYNLLQAKAENHGRLLTFGGAYSNHIAAVAAAGKESGFQTVGIIRGDELSTAVRDNPTLALARENGMQFEFVSRETYRNKENPEFIARLKEKFGEFYLLPEGGTNALAVKGCEEILADDDFLFDYICCAAGTGGTVSGVINSAAENQRILVFPALKGNFLEDEIARFSKPGNWEMKFGYDFGGYAKITPELVGFINRFHAATKTALDPVYTGKMIFGVMDLIEKEYFPKGSKILAIHTGGLQGILGMNEILKKKNLPLIDINA